MEVIALPPTGTVYVDSNSIIYLVEKIEPYLAGSQPLWDALDGGTQEVVTSQLTLLEVLVKPLREGKTDVVNRFRDVLTGTVGLTCLPISIPVIEAAARLRADYNMKTPDALHAATALDSGCVMFVTNDAGFQRVPGLDVALLSRIASS